MRFIYWVLVATVLFGIGLAAGTAIGDTALADFIEKLLEQFPTIEDTGVVLGVSTAGLLIFLLVKNILAVAVSVIFAPFFGIFPALSLVMNGMLISYVVSRAIEQESLGYVISLLAPHGVIEIPAFLVAQAAALSFGAAAIYALITRDRDGKLIINFKKNLKILLIAMACLVPAAIIEAFVTPLFIN
ncbi:MAG: stage II sporulation protein M [Dehalococcoidales bacterium]|nr:stage II sporulation protein M [Dehalococcoidales bacterium]